MTAQEELVEALRKSKAAWATFEAMPPSHRKRWVAFIEEAKKPETRVRRIARCIEELETESSKGSAMGYSGTPLLQKLGIREGHRVALLDAPDQPPNDLTRMPDGVSLERGLRGDGFDVILLFAGKHAILARRFGVAAGKLKPDGGLWVAWPKRSSGVATDLTEDRVRDVALAAGLVDNKVCSIDEVWSGLRCVYRRKDRP